MRSGNLNKKKHCSNKPGNKPISPEPNPSRLSHLFISESLYETVKETVGKGLLSSFLCTLTEEITARNLNDHCDETNIFVINQVLRSLILWSLGSTADIVIGTPLSTYLLIECLALNRTDAIYMATGGVWAVNLLMTTPILNNASKAFNGFFSQNKINDIAVLSSNDPNKFILA